MYNMTRKRLLKTETEFQGFDQPWKTYNLFKIWLEIIHKKQDKKSDTHNQNQTIKV